VHGEGIVEFGGAAVAERVVLDPAAGLVDAVVSRADHVERAAACPAWGSAVSKALR